MEKFVQTVGKKSQRNQHNMTKLDMEESSSTKTMMLSPEK